jgi:hypothetical protein
LNYALRLYIAMCWTLSVWRDPRDPIPEVWEIDPSGSGAILEELMRLTHSVSPALIVLSTGSRYTFELAPSCVGIGEDEERITYIVLENDTPVWIIRVFGRAVLLVEQEIPLTAIRV